MGLARRHFWIVFALALALFFFVAGPVWRHPFEIDGPVYLSYLAIPPLVLGAQWLTKRLAWRAFFLDSLEVGLYKFGATYLLATVMWAAAGAPPPRSDAVPVVAARAAAPALPPLPAGERGSVSGVVVGPGGAPRAGALVYVASGAERWSFPTRADAVTLENDGAAYHPAVAAVQVGEPLVLRSTDGHTHTLRGEDDAGRALFNVAVLSGAARPMTLDRAAGLVTVGCTMHDHAGREKKAKLAVLANPFFTYTDGEGRFRLDGVPAGALRLEAVDAELGEAAVGVSAAKGGEARSRIAVPGPS